MNAAPFRPAVGAEPVPGYRLEAFLGRGGFGEVWRAVGPGGFPVALKFLAAEGTSTERELRSLRMLQRIRDGHLLSIHGVWAVPGFFVLAMELADRTLLDRLKECLLRGLPGIPQPELLRYCLEAAEGLDYLNEPIHLLEPDGAPVGIVHGDVKPENLMLVGRGCKVADFGLSRRLSESVAAHSTNSMTVEYAATEVFDCKISRFTDQYALAVSWRLLRGGRRPFSGNQAQVMAGHLRREPDLSMLPELERAPLRKALSKEPRERWPTCRAFVEALGRAAPMDAPAPPRPNEDAVPTTSNTSERTGPPPLPPPPAPPRPDGRSDTTPDAPKGGTRLPGWRMLLALAAVALVTATVVLGAIWLSGPKGQSGPSSDASQTSRDREVRRDKRDKDGSRPDPKKPAAEFVNTVGMKMVWIEPGEFLMGSPDGKMPPGMPAEEDRSSEEMPHHVKLTRGYYMAATLVTQEQWEKVMGKYANPSKFGGDKRQLPVDNVSWGDCQEFCKKLSDLDGRRYALPTEAEWEYGCRAGTTTTFWFGKTINTDQANYDGNYAYGKGGKKTGVSREKTTSVEQFPANPWGLHDMHGNLWQWCEDWYNPYPYRDVTDPVSLTKGERDARVLRGGSWTLSPWYCRAASREWYGPAGRRRDYGCRVVCRLD
jgi:formylglycine-generating enzyme required for sulfatase activity